MELKKCWCGSTSYIHNMDMMIVTCSKCGFCASVKHWNSRPLTDAEKLEAVAGKWKKDNCYMEIMIYSGSQKIVRKMRMGKTKTVDKYGDRELSAAIDAAWRAVMNSKD